MKQGGDYESSFAHIKFQVSVRYLYRAGANKIGLKIRKEVRLIDVHLGLVRMYVIVICT